MPKKVSEQPHEASNGIPVVPELDVAEVKEVFNPDWKVNGFVRVQSLELEELVGNGHRKEKIYAIRVQPGDFVLACLKARLWSGQRTLIYPMATPDGAVITANHLKIDTA